MLPGRPPYDAELAIALEALPLPGTVTSAGLAARRELERSPAVDDVIGGRAVRHETVTVHGPGGPLPLSVFRRTEAGRSGPSPCIYFVHGGGMVVGDRHAGVGVALDWVERFGAVCISVEYRLAPEHPHPAAVDDCVAGLLWAAGAAAGLGIDRDRIVLCGSSAGGGIAAAAAIELRGCAGFALAGVMLLCPMLDPTGASVSSTQFADNPVWDAASNTFGWHALLGDGAAGWAPVAGTTLEGLPSTFIDVGSAELFRDEDVAFAAALWAAGVQCESHVWPGGFHEFDQLVPDAALSRIATRTRTAWLGRVLHTPIVAPA